MIIILLLSYICELVLLNIKHQTKMKKSFLFLAVASVFALASCGGEKPAETAPVDSVSVATVDSAAAVADSAATVADSAASVADSVASAVK